jgi:hypothetical protein
MAMNFCHIVRVTGDETWVLFMDVETKKQSKQWMHTHHQTSRKSSNKCCLPARKLMATVYLDKKGVLMGEFTQQGTTLKSEVYCETLKKNCVDPAIQKERVEC